MATRATRAEKLAKIEEQQRRLREREQKLQAQKQRLIAAESKEERRRDTRRKILVGSMVLAAVEAGKRSRDELLRELDAYLTQDRDRELFDLSTADAAHGNSPKEASDPRPNLEGAPITAHA